MGEDPHPQQIYYGINHNEPTHTLEVDSNLNILSILVMLLVIDLDISLLVI